MSNDQTASEPDVLFHSLMMTAAKLYGLSEADPTMPWMNELNTRWRCERHRHDDFSKALEMDVFTMEYDHVSFWTLTARVNALIDACLADHAVSQADNVIRDGVEAVIRLMNGLERYIFETHIRGTSAVPVEFQMPQTLSQARREVSKTNP